jgi:glucose-1-phosphate cytidylyltransferase
MATLTGVRPSTRFGELRTEGNRVVSFAEKPKMNQSLINGGFFCFEPDFLRYLDDSPSCTLERTPLEQCAAEGNLCVFEHSGYWQCMDTYRDWQSLESQWQNGTAPWKVWDLPGEFESTNEIPERWRSVAHLLGAA